MLIIDPIVSAIKGDSHKASETRRGLQPVVDFAAKHNAVVFGIAHFTKGTAGNDPLERVSGSGAFGAVPRIVYTAAKEAQPEDPMNPKRSFIRTKSNIGPSGGGFDYAVRWGALPGKPDIESSWVEFGEPLTGTARELLAEIEAAPDDKQETTLDGAKAWLSALLADGELAQKEIDAEAKAIGISEKTLRRAKTDLGIKSRKDGLNGWFWSCRSEGLEKIGRRRIQR